MGVRPAGPTGMYTGCSRNLFRGENAMPDERIILDPAILAGTPVVRGTRLSVEFHHRTDGRRLV
jgi:hypothetical protein